jgi:hypothetical protein
MFVVVRLHVAIFRKTRRVPSSVNALFERLQVQYGYRNSDCIHCTVLILGYIRKKGTAAPPRSVTAHSSVYAVRAVRYPVRGTVYIALRVRMPWPVQLQDACRCRPIVGVSLRTPDRAHSLPITGFPPRVRVGREIRRRRGVRSHVRGGFHGQWCRREVDHRLRGGATTASGATMPMYNVCNAHVTYG